MDHRNFPHGTFPGDILGAARSVGYATEDRSIAERAAKMIGQFQSPPPQPVSALMEAANDLEEAMSRLHGAIGRLEDRLASVLPPRPMTAAEGHEEKPSAPRRGCSPAVNMASVTRDQVYLAIRRLDELASSVEA